MHMLGTVVSQILNKVGTWKAQWSAKASEFKKHCSNIIVAGIDRMTLIVQYIKLKFVALKLNIKRLVAQLINRVLLIKVGILNVLHKVGQLGQRLVTTARQILQRVLNLLKRGN
jgi:hypothetical protein